MSDGQPAMEPPELGQTRRVNPFALLGRLTKGIGRLAEIVLKEPRFGQGTAELQGLVTGGAGLLHRPDEQGRGIRSLAALQGFGGFSEEVGRRHARQYSWYTAVRIEGLQNDSGRSD